MPARTRVHRLLPPVPSSGIADTVGRRLSDAIHLGLLAPGDQLPSESALSGQLGVSTVSLREALSALRERGLVETRRGRHGGTFVCGPADLSTNHLRRRLLDVPVIGLRDLGDEWSAVAGAAARLAAARSSADQVVRMRSFVDGLSDAESIGDRSRAHSRFFIEIALASQSERLTRAEVRLQTEIGDLCWIPVERPIEPFDPASAVRAMAAIVDAIANEDGGTARDLVERHVLGASRWIIDTRLELADGHVV